ncbi:MAG: ABC transporter permease [Calditrichaeota bacterium]|nr:ABC transporter permease [Calditrichota bacterium]
MFNFNPQSAIRISKSGEIMFKNYLKIAFRILGKQKVYAFINVFGLSIGIACCIFIYLFVLNEWSYDRFHEKAVNLYRIYITEDLPKRDPFSYAESPAQLAGALEESFPEVERAVRLDIRTDVIRIGDNTFTERYHLADSDFFEMFSFPLRNGTPASVLQSLNSVVLTERVALKLFGSAEVLQERLAIKVGPEFHDFTVSGIAENPPLNSSIQFDIVIPIENVKKYRSQKVLNAWFDVFYETYVQLSPQHDPSNFEGKLATVVKKHYPTRSADMVTLHLQPITDIHLNSDVPAGFEPTNDPSYSYILIGIALLVLTIACINFTTLAIGRSSSRSREVGVRKVLGALKSQLVKQFWAEAILMSFLALLVALLLVELVLPFFNNLAGKELTTSFDPLSLFVLFLLTLIVGLSAGGYPAFVLSRSSPISIIKGTDESGPRHFWGNGLIVLQFAFSIFFIISTLLMADQLHYLRNKNLGFNNKEVVAIRNYAPLSNSQAVVERFRQALGKRPEILGVAGTSTNFAMLWTQMGFKTDDGSFRQFYQLTVDHEYLPTMGIEFLEGRNFSPRSGTDSTEAVIVNQTLANYFDWASAIDKSLPGQNFPQHRIIGVVKDFHFDALNNEIAPLAMVLNPITLLRGINDISTSLSPRTLNFINIRISPENTLQTIRLLKSTWKQVAADQPFSFSFLEQDLERQYRQEERWSKIAAYASLFAILIASLGLFGLATLAVSKRTKEMGVRKVLGATVTNVVALLSKDFVRLVLLANIIAWPVAWYAIQKWLQEFAYRIEISWWVFALSGGLALVIALLTVSTQAIRAALANPVESLRYE